MIPISQRVRRIQESGTTKMTPIVERLRREGRKIISFAVGEPEWETPPEVVSATQKALVNGHTRYDAVAGLGLLREKLADPLEQCGPGNILISNGAKQGLYTLFQAICDEGDEVIIPSPCWVSFPQQIKLAGATPVLVDTASHQLDVDAVKRAIGKKTRAVLINSPNNPTGAVYPRKALLEIADLCLRNNLTLISDEAYDAFVFDDLDFTSAWDLDQIRDRLVVVKSFSKRYCMTGFRIGYTVGPEALISQMAKLQGHSTGNVCTFAQYGALSALSMDDRVFAGWKTELQKKRDLAYAEASALFECIRPQGAFYLFPNISGHLAPGDTDEDFAAFLLEKTGVAVVAGSAFGQGDHIRISFAVSEGDLIEGFARIKEVL